MIRCKKIYLFAAIVLAVVTATSCSPTRKLTKGEYLLTNNHVIVTNSRSYPTSDISAYIKQGSAPGFLGIISPFADPVVMDLESTGSSSESIIRHLEYKGYYKSTVDTIVSRRGKKAIVNYLVKLGKYYPIKRVDYYVDDPLIKQIFAEDSTSRTIHDGMILSEESLEAEATRIATLLRNKGYYTLNKNFMFNIADTMSVPDSALLRIELRNYTRNESPSMARPFKQHVISNVNYELPGNLDVKFDFLEDINLIENGMPYSEELISTTYQRFAGNRIFNTVNISLTPVDTIGNIDCTIALTPSKMQNFEVNMDASTNSAGLIGLTPSFTYNHFNLFRSGEVFNLGFRGNFQFKINDSTHSNEFAITTGIRFPKLLLLHSFINSTTPNMPSTDISLAYNYQNRPEYTRNIFSGSYGYTWRSVRNLRFAVNLPTMSIIKIFDLDPDFYSNLNSSSLQYLYQDHFDIGANASVYYTTNPNVNPSSSYFYFRGDVASSGLFLSALNPFWEENRRGQRIIWGIPYSQYIRTQISGVGTIRFGRDDKLSLATRLLAGVGYAYGNSLFSMPLEQMFYAGGANSMRGWQSRTIGPGLSPLDESFSIYNQVGDMRLEANLEFRFPMFWKLNGAVFTDIGNIWNLPKREGFTDAEYDLSVFSFKNLTKSTGLDWGLGARLDFGLLLIRIDWGVRQYDPALQKWLVPREWFSKDGCAIHLGIGYPF